MSENKWITSIGKNLFNEISFSIGDKVFDRYIWDESLNMFIRVYPEYNDLEWAKEVNRIEHSLKVDKIINRKSIEKK